MLQEKDAEIGSGRQECDTGRAKRACIDVLREHEGFWCERN